MQAPLPPLTAPDLEQLRLLTLFNRIAMWVFLVGSCFGLPHTIIGAMVVSGSIPSGNKANEFPSFMGYFFMFAGIAVIVIHLGLSFFCGLAAKWIDGRSHYGHLIAQAVILCLWMPIGTALGVFTFVVLTKPQIKAAFGQP